MTVAIRDSAPPPPPSFPGCAPWATPPRPADRGGEGHGSSSDRERFLSASALPSLSRRQRRIRRRAFTSVAGPTDAIDRDHHEHNRSATPAICRNPTQMILAERNRLPAAAKCAKTLAMRGRPLTRCLFCGYKSDLFVVWRFFARGGKGRCIAHAMRQGDRDRPRGRAGPGSMGRRG
jgi:hypothetical protein